MLKIQPIYRRKTTDGVSTRVRYKVADLVLGLKPSVMVNVYSNGEILFYSKSGNLPDRFGFTKLAKRKPFKVGRDELHTTIPATWAKHHCQDISYLKVIYTDIGIFLKPYKGEL